MSLTERPRTVRSRRAPPRPRLNTERCGSKRGDYRAPRIRRRAHFSSEPSRSPPPAATALAPFVPRLSRERDREREKQQFQGAPNACLNGDAENGARRRGRLEKRYLPAHSANRGERAECVSKSRRSEREGIGARRGCHGRR
ncbi:unnamed protein product [Lampetra fluviatilis]